MRHLIFDTETTGLPKDWRAPVSEVDNWPRLVELAWGVFSDDGLPIDGRSLIVKPDGFEIPEDATRIHAITTRGATAFGKPVAEVLASFYEAAGRADVLVAHNLDFDRKVVQAELVRAKFDDLFAGRPSVCTMRQATDFCALPQANGRGFKFPKLDELHEKLFGKKPEGAHQARRDVLTCARCYFDLLRLGVAVARR